VHLEKTHKCKSVTLKSDEMAGCSFQTFMLEQDTSAHINQNTLPDLDLKSINIPNTIQHLKKQALHLSLNLYQESFMPRNQVLKVQKMISSLFLSASTAIEKTLNNNENNEDLNCILNFCKNPFIIQNVKRTPFVRGTNRQDYSNNNC